MTADPAPRDGTAAPGAAGMLRAALIQLNVGDDLAENLPVTAGYVRDAAAQGATLIATPEATNLLSPSRDWQRHVLRPQDDDPTLAALRDEAARAGIWLLIGSLALKAEEGDRFVNRSFLIAPDGAIAAQYNKIHMFDVTLSDSESYRESAAYRPGARAVIGAGPVPVGMTICYDLRFAQLHRRLAQAGASVLTVPSAFSPTTGAAHWHVLLRARAIETGCFVLAPAQCGLHPAANAGGKPPRRSFGHSLAVDPWGTVLADAGPERRGVTIVDLDLTAIDKARSRVPSLTHDRAFDGP